MRKTLRPYEAVVLLMKVVLKRIAQYVLAISMALAVAVALRQGHKSLPSNGVAGLKLLDQKANEPVGVDWEKGVDLSPRPRRLAARSRVRHRWCAPLNHTETKRFVGFAC